MEEDALRKKAERFFEGIICYAREGKKKKSLSRFKEAICARILPMNDGDEDLINYGHFQK